MHTAFNNSDVTEIESGKETASIGGTVNYFYGTNDTTQKITYSVSDEDKAYVKLTDNGDGTCKVEGTNNDDAARKVIINASTESGLEAAVGITVKQARLKHQHLQRHQLLLMTDREVLK